MQFAMAGAALLGLAGASIGQFFYEGQLPPALTAVCDFKEPAEPLTEQNITAFVLHYTHSQLLFDAQQIDSVAEHYNSNAVLGRMRAVDGLAQYIAGTNLRFELVNRVMLTLVLTKAEGGNKDTTSSSGAPPRAHKRRKANRREIGRECHCATLTEFNIPTPWCWDGDTLKDGRKEGEAVCQND